MQLQATGVILKEVCQPEEYGNKVKQIVVFEEDAQTYPQVLVCQLSAKQLEHASKLQVGKKYDIKFNAKGYKAKNGTWYCNTEVWSIYPTK